MPQKITALCCNAQQLGCRTKLQPGMCAQVFQSYVQSLDEDPAQYRKDTEQMEAWAKELSSPSDLTPSSDGTDLQKRLAGIAQDAKDGECLCPGP